MSHVYRQPITVMTQLTSCLINLCLMSPRPKFGCPPFYLPVQLPTEWWLTMVNLMGVYHPWLIFILLHYISNVSHYVFLYMCVMIRNIRAKFSRYNGLLGVTRNSEIWPFLSGVVWDIIMRSTRQVPMGKWGLAKACANIYVQATK